LGLGDFSTFSSIFLPYLMGAVSSRVSEQFWISWRRLCHLAVPK